MGKACPHSPATLTKKSATKSVDPEPAKASTTRKSVYQKILLYRKAKHQPRGEIGKGKLTELEDLLHCTHSESISTSQNLERLDSGAVERR